MEPRRLSASSVKTFLQCLLKYYNRYYAKKSDDERSDPLALGTAVHEALEELYTIIDQTKELPTPDVYKKVQKVFMDSATKNGLKDLSLYQLGKDFVTKYLDNANLEEKIVGLELKFDLKTPNGTPYLGSIDKVLEIDEETAVVIDYKTSKFALPQDEADTDIQLSMYDLAVHTMYPQYKTIILAFDYLRMDEEVITYRTPEQRALFVEFLDSVYDSMKSMDEEDMKPTLNIFCGWCSSKNHCPAYAKAVTEVQLPLPNLSGLSEEEFVDTWVNFSNVKKAIDARQRSLKDHAYSRLRSGVKKIKGDAFEVYTTQSSRVTYNAKSVLKVTGPEKFASMASVNKTAVDKYIQNNPEHKEALVSAASFSYNSPSFRHRKVKKDGNS